MSNPSNYCIYATTIKKDVMPIKIARALKNLELAVRLEKMFNPRRDDAQSK